MLTRNEFLSDAILQMLETNAQRWLFIQSNASILQTMKRALERKLLDCLQIVVTLQLPGGVTSRLMKRHVANFFLNDQLLFSFEVKL